MKSPGRIAPLGIGVCGVLIMLDIGRTYVLVGAALVCLAVALFYRDGPAG